MDHVENLDLCSFRCCCMPVLLVISYHASWTRPHPLASSDALALFIQLVPWAGNDVF